MIEFLFWLWSLPWWAKAIGFIAWCGLAFLFANLFGETSRLGGPDDIRRRR